MTIGTIVTVISGFYLGCSGEIIGKGKKDLIFWNQDYNRYVVLLTCRNSNGVPRLYTEELAQMDLVLKQEGK